MLKWLLEWSGPSSFDLPFRTSQLKVNFSSLQPLFNNGVTKWLCYLKGTECALRWVTGRSQWATLPSCPVISLTFLAKLRGTKKSFSHPLLVRDFKSSSKRWLSLKANIGTGIFSISCRQIQGLALKMDLCLTSPTNLSSLLQKSYLFTTEPH